MFLGGEPLLRKMMVLSNKKEWGKNSFHIYRLAQKHIVRNSASIVNSNTLICITGVHIAGAVVEFPVAIARDSIKRVKFCAV
jgi:hypothetical protein